MPKTSRLLKNKAVQIIWRETCKTLMPPKRVLSPEHIELRSAVLHLKQGVGLQQCVYCGDEANSKDHFKPIILANGMPSGSCDDDWNMLPACTTCNSSKGNKHWLAFMNSRTSKSPKGRGLHANAVKARVNRLLAFERLHREHAQNWAFDQRQIEKLRNQVIRMTALHAKRVQQFQSSVVQASHSYNTRLQHRLRVQNI
jgi:hypothetical protein